MNCNEWDTSEYEAYVWILSISWPSLLNELWKKSSFFYPNHQNVSPPHFNFWQAFLLLLIPREPSPQDLANYEKGHLFSDAFEFAISASRAVSSRPLPIFLLGPKSPITNPWGFMSSKPSPGFMRPHARRNNASGPQRTQNVTRAYQGSFSQA